LVGGQGELVVREEEEEGGCGEFEEGVVEEGGG
jgi:hypothetical protein